MGRVGVAQRNLTKHGHGMRVILTSAPLAKVESADGIGRGDAGQDGQGCRDVGLAAVFAENEFGHVEKGLSLSASRAAFGRGTRDDAA